MDESVLSQLVTAARAGDRLAGEQLFHACYRDLRVFVSVRLRGGGDETDEVVQASFIAALGGLQGFRGEASFLTWLKSIASNKIARVRRDQARRQPWSDELGELLLAPMEDAAAPEMSELAQRLPQCLERLSPAARLLVQRRWVERVAVQDLAASLGRSANSLSVTLHRLRSSLRACLEAAHG